MRRFDILKSMTVGDRLPFLIIETTETLDGPRSRICDGRWASWKDAADHLKPIDPTVFATHELSLYLKDCRTIQYREDFYGSDVEASFRLTEIWNDRTPANGSGYQATIRRYGEAKPYEQIG